MEDFVRPYLVVFGTAAVLFIAWRVVRAVLIATGRWGAERVVDAVRGRHPAATVDAGANAWSCRRCRSVNRPDAVACYSCRGDRADVEQLQGRI